MLKQISIFTENRKGAMRSITHLLATGGIDIDAFVTNDSAEFGIVRMLVSDPDKASAMLTAAGYQIKRTPVMAFEIPDEPGSLDRAAVEALYGPRLSLSAPKVDKLAACKFGYFLQYGL